MKISLMVARFVAVGRYVCINWDSTKKFKLQSSDIEESKLNNFYIIYLGLLGFSSYIMVWIILHYSPPRSKRGANSETQLSNGSFFTAFQVHHPVPTRLKANALIF